MTKVWVGMILFHVIDLFTSIDCQARNITTPEALMNKVLEHSFANVTFPILSPMTLFYPDKTPRISVINIANTAIYGLEETTCPLSNSTIDVLNSNTFSVNITIPTVFINGSVKFLSSDKSDKGRTVSWEIIAISGSIDISLDVVYNDVVKRLAVKKMNYVKKPEFVVDLNYSDGFYAVGQFVLNKFRCQDLSRHLITVVHALLINTRFI
ncbi:hypothetical protein HDE_12714 [Halotydeus destructor]|nr:hypothetical protein HDE_12714 [Halotydeus destructor]